jgi:hypothetical protein
MRKGLISRKLSNKLDLINELVIESYELGFREAEKINKAKLNPEKFEKKNIKAEKRRMKKLNASKRKLMELLRADLPTIESEFPQFDDRDTP